MEWRTSYYGNLKNIPDDWLCVGISRRCPDGITRDNFIFVENNLLAPSEELLRKYKNGEIGNDEYKREFVVNLFKRFEETQWETLEDWARDVEKTYGEKYKGIVLLCYEKPGDFCHRHIIAKLLTGIYDIECFEFENNKKETALF